jgi:Mg-chelatase subunit ChlD
MKSKILALAILAFTATTVGLYPQLQGAATGKPVTATPPAPDQLANPRPRVEVAFVLDTTGSMGGLIQAAKEKIWSIASTMAAAQPAPEIRMGLVAYRDRGDAYVTRVVDLSSDLDSVYATLMDFQAQGGGDGPESVNQALHDAVQKLSWSQDDQTYRVIFLVGDAPPHMDYPNDIKWPATLKVAQSRGIRVNTIQCGRTPATKEEWRKIADLGQGSFFQVEQAGSAVAIATPYDERLAKLSAELDGTRLYYGDEEDKKKQTRKLEATKKLNETASVTAKARRATFNASKGGEANLLGEKELVDDVTSGRVDLDTIEPEELPAPLQSMSAGEQKALITATGEHRTDLKRRMKDLADQRAAYLRDKVEESGAGEGSLDEGIFRTVREQAGSVGLEYDAAAPAY